MVSTDHDGAHALLLTGPYGSGKSSVVDEITSVLEERGVSFAALDLDWLAWFSTGETDGHADREMLLRNLDAVVGNYVEIGIRRFVMALALETSQELQQLRDRLAMPVFVVRLAAPIELIAERLSHETTTGRRADLEAARAQISQGLGLGLEDAEVSNIGPIRSVALEVMARAGWDRPV